MPQETELELLEKISKSLSSLHKRISKLENTLDQFKNSMPVRKRGWTGDYWEIQKK